ncbi:MAG: hypothetical protein GC168_04335 [Candidatus Hydrogenedens sp.]|nr:hypothetical protein [Candidatus Hydrogenedens sp.]
MALFALLAVGLGLLHLDAPSLWHDELVHIFVAEDIAYTGTPNLPSGMVYPSALAFNYLLAAFVRLSGSDAFSMRLPSVLLSGANVVLLYLLARAWLGRGPALLAALLLALSPWHLAWARQARPYELQLFGYLVFLLGAWKAADARDTRAAWSWAGVALAGYLAGVLSTFHAILFLGPVGGFALLMAASERRWRTRWTAGIALCGIVGTATLGALLYNPNPADKQAVFSNARIGGELEDPNRLERDYYGAWLRDNLSTGVWLAAIVGTLALAWRRDRKALFAVLAFWVPLLVLTFLIGYRRPRFLYFAYPVYVLLSTYGIWTLARWCWLWRAHWIWAPVSLATLAFLVRLGWSLLLLTGSTLETAAGSPTTLATRHPQWEQACAWVNHHRDPDTAIITTTHLPVLYYVEQVDEWFPNRYTPWEKHESGLNGLASLEELQAFMRRHPKGFFIAEFSRFQQWRDHGAIRDQLGPEVDWVETHMRRVPRACTDDVTVFAWGGADE